MSDLFSCCVYIYMLQLLNSPIFEGHEKKPQPIQKKLHAGSELSPTFFWWLFKQTIGDLCLGVLVLRWEDYFRRSARWRQRCVVKKTGGFWSIERSYRTEVITALVYWLKLMIWIGQVAGTHGVWIELTVPILDPTESREQRILIWDRIMDLVEQGVSTGSKMLDRMLLLVYKGGGEGKSPPESPIFNLDSACNHGWSTYRHPNVPPEIRVE